MPRPKTQADAMSIFHPLYSEADINSTLNALAACEPLLQEYLKLSGIKNKAHAINTLGLIRRSMESMYVENKTDDTGTIKKIRGTRRARRS